MATLPFQFDLDDGTPVTYHGSVARLVGEVFYTEDCYRCTKDGCLGYQLINDQDDVVLRHVRRTSITRA